MKDAFKHNNGATVPLVWNHQHDDPCNVLGKAELEHRDEGVFAYCKFNESENGQLAKVLVQHGDITQLSICANQLKQQGGNVLHGEIREVSLVHAGANRGATISAVIRHSADGEVMVSDDETEGIIYTGEDISLYHSDEKKDEKEATPTVAEETKKTEGGEKTVADVFNEFTEEQKTVVYAMIGQALEDAGVDVEENKSEGDDETMKHNVFDQGEAKQENVLTHADQMNIIDIAKKTSVGSFREALRIYSEENGTLSHGLDLGDTDVLNELLPDYKNLTPGAPEILGPDQSWVMSVINKIHKSPYSRIRTRHADARAQELREKLKAKGYTKAEQKKLTEHIKLIGRSFDPQTIYIKDELNRDDIVDITDFSIVEYVWNLMKANLYETLALAVLVGDGREDTDPDKIKEDHIRSIWHDDELYTMHKDVDFAAAKAELQGTDTNAHFGDNYIYTEAIITAALYAREKFKGSGRPDFYCDPHLVNVMLLARDLNGRRIYDSKADLAKALNVGAIHEIEQLAGRTRVDSEGNTKKLLGLFVNLSDYQFGSTKGGEVTKFEDFDIDFNKYQYLMETRLSGALNRIESAIALEEPVTEG
jgi:HK97 family phage prohead protease